MSAAVEDLMQAFEDLQEMVRDAIDTARPIVELSVLDAQIADLQLRRSALVGWSPTEPCDWALAREVARWQGNDPGRSWSMTKTQSWMAEPGLPFTAAVMTATFGPQWRAVVALVRFWAGRSSAERSAYYDVRKVWNDAAWNDAYRAVVVYGGPGGAARRALLAFGGHGGYAVVASALARRHEVAATHYDLLTGPWRSLGWTVHPDDGPLS